MIGRAAPFAVLAALLLVASAKGEAVPKDIARKLDSVLRRPVEAGNVVGATGVVLRGEEIAWAGAFGHADPGSAEPMRTSTPLRSASVGKLVTAALAVHLADRGALHLDDPLAPHLPELAGWLPDGVTFRRALRHTTGLPDYLAADERRMLETGGPLTEAWAFEALRGLEPQLAVGERWAYCNSAFYLVAIALERITGTSWPELIAETVAAPLGVESLQPCDPLIEAGELRGFEVGAEGAAPDAFYVELGVKGDGGLCVTATDLALLARRLETGDYLGPSGFEEMSRPTLLPNGDVVDYGLGVRRGELAGHALWGHTGSIGAYVAVVMRFPDDDVTVAVLQNTLSAGDDALVMAWHLAEAALELPPPAPGEPRPVDDAARYVGKYRMVGEVTAENRIRVTEEGTLERWRGADAPVVPLIPEGDSRFGRADWPRDKVVFHGDGDRATGFSLYAAGMFATYYWRVD